MEQEDELQLFHLDTHNHTIRDLQLFMIKHIEKGFTVNLAMDINESDINSF
jgi:hypothetical protein